MWRQSRKIYVIRGDMRMPVERTMEWNEADGLDRDAMHSTNHMVI